MIGRTARGVAKASPLRIIQGAGFARRPNRATSVGSASEVRCAPPGRNEQPHGKQGPLVRSRIGNPAPAGSRAPRQPDGAEVIPPRGGPADLFAPTALRNELRRAPAVPVLDVGRKNKTGSPMALSDPRRALNCAGIGLDDQRAPETHARRWWENVLRRHCALARFLTAANNAIPAMAPRRGGYGSSSIHARRRGLLNRPAQRARRTRPRRVSSPILTDARARRRSTVPSDGLPVNRGPRPGTVASPCVRRPLVEGRPRRIEIDALRPTCKAAGPPRDAGGDRRRRPPAPISNDPEFGGDRHRGW